MMLGTEKYRRMVEELQQLTEQGKIRWESTVNPGVIIAAVKGEITFTLERYAEPSERHPTSVGFGTKATMDKAKASPIYRLILRSDDDQEGIEINSGGPGATEEIHQKLRDLYQVAEYQARRVGEKLDRAIKVLEGLNRTRTAA